MILTQPIQPQYKEAGDGPLVLFLHGLGGNRHAFDRQIERMKADYHCVAWDVPGYGGSTPAKHLTFEVLSDCLNTLLAVLEKTPYAVVGHSLGGMVAQTWVSRGGICEKLVLAQTTPRFGKPGSTFNEEFLSARLKPIEQGSTPADFAQKLIASMFHDTSKQGEIEAAIATMAPLPASVYKQAIECLVTFDELSNLPNINCDTLCLAAEFDTTASPKAVQKMADAIQGACYQCLSDAGHLAYLEQADAFTNAISNFLE